MKIRFNAEPSMYAPLIREALQKDPEALTNGQTVSVKVPIQAATKRGFERRVTVTVTADPDYFETDWPGADPSRFGAKLRAAATMLRQLGFEGAFVVEHEGQFITIARAR